jgi:hypothetical protein
VQPQVPAGHLRARAFFRFENTRHDGVAIVLIEHHGDATPHLLDEFRAQILVEIVRHLVDKDLANIVEGGGDAGRAPPAPESPRGPLAPWEPPGQAARAAVPPEPSGKPP